MTVPFFGSPAVSVRPAALRDHDRSWVAFVEKRTFARYAWLRERHIIGRISHRGYASNDYAIFG